MCLCKPEVHSNFLGQRDMSSTREEVTGWGDVGGKATLQGQNYREHDIGRIQVLPPGLLGVTSHCDSPRHA